MVKTKLHPAGVVLFSGHHGPGPVPSLAVQVPDAGLLVDGDARQAIEAFFCGVRLPARGGDVEAQGAVFRGAVFGYLVSVEVEGAAVSRGVRDDALIAKEEGLNDAAGDGAHRVIRWRG